MFRKLDAKGCAFIEYAPLEKAWVPIEGENYYYRWFPYSDQGAVNMSDSGNRAKCSPKAKMVLGVTADWQNNSYTRTDNAVGLSAGANFDQFKMFGGRRRCIVADDRTIE